jgi:hypothetical protein
MNEIINKPETGILADLPAIDGNLFSLKKHHCKLDEK